MAMDMEMDLGVVSVTRTRTPDSDTETPPRNPPTKRVHHTHAPYVSYKECMKNHAASIGGHALDGCCEFMPGPTFNLMDPTSLKCGACGCHRNFHRRDPDDPTPLNHSLIPARGAHSPPSASQLLLSLSHSPSGPSDEVNPTAGGALVGYVSPGGQSGNFTSGKKRFRTKFTLEQKEKMHEFSEKIGWKLRKGEERLVEDFVKDIGVGRNVFKVWMHNNKHNNSNSNNNNNNIVAGSINRDNVVVNYEQQQQQQQHSSSNGSKSTSTNTTTTSNVGVGNCGASVFDNHNHVHNLNLNHHRQFNFANGGGQEAAQAQ